MLEKGVDFAVYSKITPDKDGYFGTYGGAYIPPQLVEEFQRISTAYQAHLIEINPYFVGSGIHNLSFFRIIQDGEEFIKGYYHKPKFLNDLKISRFLKGEEYIENAGGKIIVDKNGLGFLLREMNNEFLEFSSSISRELGIYCAHCLMHNDSKIPDPIKYQ